jgi:Enolase C-terminal domain-like
VDLPLYRTLPAFHDQVPVYSSGGFTNYPLDRLADQLAGWVEQGILQVKMKIARQPEKDPARLAAVRKAIGDEPLLLVDANGAHARKEALGRAWRLGQEFGMSWLEGPVSSDDITGLGQLRAAGRPGWTSQPGSTGSCWPTSPACSTRRRSTACRPTARGAAASPACSRWPGWPQRTRSTCPRTGAPAVSAHAFCGVERLRHLEYFHDHMRIESVLFDGAPAPVRGALHPDPSSPGLGLELRTADAVGHQVHYSTHPAH